MNKVGVEFYKIAVPSGLVQDMTALSQAAKQSLFYGSYLAPKSEVRLFYGL